MNKVIKATPLPGGYVQVELQNGRCGEFDVNPYMTSDCFLPLKNEAWFQKVALFFAGIGWPDGQDLGPDTVAAQLRVSQSLVH
ncbi:MAG: DUF2442 domain-containing protein [Chlorobium sp.]